MDTRKDRWRTPLSLGSAAFGLALARLPFDDGCLIKRHDLILLAVVVAPSMVLDAHRLIRRCLPATAK